MNRIVLSALPDIPEVGAGDDVGALVCDGLRAAGIGLESADLILIAQKIISKAEDRTVVLSTVQPSPDALELARKTGKDARLVELILRESAEISRHKRGVLVTRHKLGFVSANAGIDRSNVPQRDGETVLLLPKDPDRSAHQIRQTIHDQFGHWVGVLITDSHGRPHRLGTTGVVLGAAGVPTLLDRRGAPDRHGYRLQYTAIGIGDELAAAASLLMGQSAESTPIIHLRGLTLSGDGSASDLYRPVDQDLYR